MSERNPRRLVALDAPSNLGLRPPAAGTVPGCYKLAGALRDARLLDRLGAIDAGVVTPPRYRPDWKPGPRVRNGPELAAYTPRLAARVGQIVDDGAFPVVLGGDCSVLLGTTLALRRRGRSGLAFIDGHSDFRHLGNSPAVGAAAGEELALVTGRGQADLTAIDDLRPYVADTDVAVLGIRDADEALAELRDLGILTRPATTCLGAGAATTAAEALRHLDRPELAGYWVHLDIDVLDPKLMPAVDSPDPGGLAWADLAALLRPIVRHRRAVGLDVTIYDPDLDPEGVLAEQIVDLLTEALVTL